MINKQSLWFVTLFSLILIIGIYYVTLPDTNISSLVANTTSENQVIEVEENDYIIAMKVQEEENDLEVMNEAQEILLKIDASKEEKNEAYKTLLMLNNKKSKTIEIEKMLKNDFNVDAAIKIKDNNINIVLASEDEGTSYANNIITSVQNMFNEQKYITIKFTN